MVVCFLSFSDSTVFELKSFFFFLKNLHTGFHNGCSNLQPCQGLPYTHILASSCYLQPLLLGGDITLRF
jgi:hypothetical protein